MGIFNSKPKIIIDSTIMEYGAVMVSPRKTKYFLAYTLEEAKEIWMDMVKADFIIVCGPILKHFQTKESFTFSGSRPYLDTGLKPITTYFLKRKRFNPMTGQFTFVTYLLN